MPRSIWKGAISFGLVTIPIKLYTATSEKSVHFDLLHKADQGSIKYQRKCSVCGEEVSWEEIARGYEYQKGHYVILSDDELNAAPLDTARTIDIVRFVPAEQIDPIHFQKTYYLVPDPVGMKAYTLLREAMTAEDKVAVAKVVLRQKEHLVLLRPYQQSFVMETLLYPDEIRPANFEEFEREVEIRPEELSMAGTLIQNLSGDFEPEEFRDRYREALLQTIEKKISGEEIKIPEVKEEAAVVDIMAALRASVERIKSERKSAPEEETGKAPVRKAG